ncbi:hypothetical protein Tco_0799849 [Tanacetum coccineum]|uniref:Uncharacterized protein n=1 Tax=Tanacetum coccineum TaxID=301880 RepID=A0ABQ4ZU49_9ASTR
MTIEGGGEDIKYLPHHEKQCTLICKKQIDMVSYQCLIEFHWIWERVHDFHLGIKSYQQKINHTAPTITFPGIEEYDMFSIVYEPVHGIIYTNSKKEKRVMRPSEITKLTNDEVEFLKLFEEEIEVRLNYRDQMRRWEINEKCKTTWNQQREHQNNPTP